MDLRRALALLLALSACATAPSPPAPPPRPDAPVASAEVVFLYSPGTRRPRDREDCSAGFNQVPTSVADAARELGARIVYVCPQATDGGVRGSYIAKRAAEIEAALDAQLARGTAPSRLFLVGHSAGAWSSLMLMGRLGEKFNAAILFAPACCGPRSERDVYPAWLAEVQPAQVQQMLRARAMAALVIAYADDPFNRPEELRFLPETYPAGVELWPVSCHQGHLTLLRDCQLDVTRRRIVDYVRSRTVASEPADLVLLGGDVRTQDPSQPVAQAVAITGRHLRAVGLDAAVRRLIGPKTRVVQLHGRLVVPGLTDAHAHLVSLGQEQEELDLRAVPSQEEAGARLAAYARAHPTGWLFGHAWDQNRWTPAAFPDRRTLDAAAPGRAVVLSRVDGHAAWASSAALAAAGITRATGDPPGGRILRRADGEPTGVLVDTAIALLDRAAPGELDDATLERYILAAARHCLRVGLVGVHDMGTSMRAAAVMRRLADAGQLPIRIYAYFRASELDRALARKPERGDSFFRTQGVKLFADGALGSRGAALLAPYSDDPKNTGLQMSSRAEIAAAARRARAAGYQITTHAIGDRAVRTVLDAYADALGEHALGVDHRFRIEHAQVVSPEDRARFARLGVIASMQPTHATSDAPWATARLGTERLTGAYAWRTLSRAGARLAFGSDFPVEAPSPLFGLYAATTRKDADGKSAGAYRTDERLSLDQALRAYTAGAAYAAHAEADRGTLVAGALADLTVLDLTGAQAEALEALRTAKVAMTIVAGRVQFEAGP